LEGANNQTNVAILKAASPPAQPSSPKVIIMLLGAAFLGGFFGVGLAVAREFYDRIVRSPADIKQTLGVELLGVMPQMKIEGRGRKLPVLNSNRLSYGSVMAATKRLTQG
jgi:capsular polysaccharide biosynthesis protein